MKEDNLNLKKNEKNFSDNFNLIYRKPVKQEIKQVLPVKLIKKRNNKKFFILAMILIVGIGGFFLFINNDGDEMINSNESTDSPDQIESNVVLDDDKNITLEEREKILKTNLANPRLSIRNSSDDEVIGLDHDGTIEAKNINVTENLNITGTGFFSYVGSLARKVTEIWATDVTTTDLNSTGNLTTGGVILNASTTTLIRANATCVIIEGSTSTSYIC